MWSHHHYCKRYLRSDDTSHPNPHRTPTTIPPFPQIWKSCEDIQIVCHSDRQLVDLPTDIVI